MPAAVGAGGEIPMMSTRDFQIPWVRGPWRLGHRAPAASGKGNPDRILVDAVAEQTGAVGEGGEELP